MIVAAVDDLLFCSKIRNVARQAGVELVFARSADAVINEVRARKPSLVVFDLNADRIQPLEAIERLRADAGLAGVRTLGFVSHVHTSLIEAAQEAGVGQVLARSAFAATLTEIVASAK